MQSAVEGVLLPSGGQRVSDAEPHRPIGLGEPPRQFVGGDGHADVILAGADSPRVREHVDDADPPGVRR
jgi:hypothetical protein